MAKINEKMEAFPRKEIFGLCSECGKEVGRFTYDGYHDYDRQKARLKKIPCCPHCGAEYIARPAFIKWEKVKNGYIAKARNGDFMIWKWGYGYKWRYRRYGAQYPDRIDFAKTKELAQKACQKHAEWKI